MSDSLPSPLVQVFVYASGQWSLSEFSLSIPLVYHSVAFLSDPSPQVAYLTIAGGQGPNGAVQAQLTQLLMNLTTGEAALVGSFEIQSAAAYVSGACGEVTCLFVGGEYDIS